MAVAVAVADVVGLADLLAVGLPAVAVDDGDGTVGRGERGGLALADGVVVAGAGGRVGIGVADGLDGVIGGTGVTVGDGVGSAAAAVGVRSNVEVPSIAYFPYRLPWSFDQRADTMPCL